MGSWTKNIHTKLHGSLASLSRHYSVIQSDVTVLGPISITAKSVRTWWTGFKLRLELLPLIEIMAVQRGVKYVWEDVQYMQVGKMRMCPSCCSSHGNLRCVEMSWVENADDKMSVTVLLWSRSILSQDISQPDSTGSHSCCYLDDNSQPPHRQGDLIWLAGLLCGGLDEHK